MTIESQFLKKILKRLKKILVLSLKVAQFCAKVVNEETMDVLDTIDEYYSEAQDREAKIEEKNCKTILNSNHINANLKFLIFWEATLLGYRLIPVN